MRKYLLGFIVGFSFVFSGIAYAVNVTVPQSTAFGDILRGNANGTYTPVATSSLGLPAWAYPFTTQSYGASTSTIIGFLNGLFSTASSTFNGSFHLPALSAGGLGVDATGLVYSGATTTAGTGLTYSGNAFNVNASQSISTLSNLTSNGFVKTSGGTGALSIDTNTYLTAETDPVVKAINGIVKSNGSLISAASNGTDYTLLTATTCSVGDFVSALTAAGAVTCSTPTSGSAYPFTPLTNFGVNTSATSTALWAQAGLFSSSTIQTTGLNLDQFGSLQQAGNTILTSSSTLGSLYLGKGAGGSYNASANNNTFIGLNAGSQNTSGANSVIIGNWSTASLSNQTSGSNNILIGYNVSLPSATQNNQINIGNIFFGTGLDGTGKTPSTGTFGIGTTSPFARFAIHANNGDVNTTLFAIASSTASATTTLYKINNKGQITGTQASTTNQGVISPIHYLHFPEATTTAWTATTSGPYVIQSQIVAPFNGTLRGARCYTDTGTLNVDTSIGSTHLTMLSLTSTPTASTWSSNNTFVVGQIIQQVSGTPASSPTYKNCELEATETP